MTLKTLVMFKLKHQEKLLNSLLEESRKLIKQLSINDSDATFLPVEDSLIHKEIAQNINTALDLVRKSSQNALIRYELVAKAIKVGLWDMTVVAGDPVNPQNEFIWGDEFRKMLGFTDKGDFPDVLDSWASRLHPDDKEWVLQAFHDHIIDHSGNTPYDLEYQLQLKTGEYRWFRATGTTIRNEEGVPLRVAGALFDIHSKKLEQEELQYEKKCSLDLLIRHELVTKAIQVALWDMKVVLDDPINPSNEFNWDDKFRQMLGYKDEQDFPNILDSWASRLHPDDKEWVLRVFRDHITDYTGETPYDVEYQLQLKTGEYRWFRATGTTIRENGVPLRVAGALFDIHDKKLKDQEHKSLLERFELINYALTEGPWDMKVNSEDPLNPQNEFLWSPQFRKLLGYYDERDFPNLLSSWSESLHPEDMDRVLHAFGEHINDYTGRTPYALDYRLRMKNGEYRWFHASGATIRNSKGVPLRVAGTIRDITNEKHEGEQSLRMQQFTEDILQKFTAAIQQVVSGINLAASQAQQQNITVAQAAGTQEKKPPAKA
ncbi:MAG: PAS domain-containing protein [Desulfitobacteriaceae bacterium]|nr:PAS domain-containing protein [Desulfitobacteriaceae bacterium]MDD4346785.1 PAS domain-containing protein [Desulfitobacteriaceae bacterium]MDD4400399.1 PAS domain-containing protein [Desulfitobacteriaceae bacterium]